MQHPAALTPVAAVTENRTHDFTHDDTRRWDEWRRTGAVAAQRSNRLARITGVVLLMAILGALTAGLW